MINKSEYPCGSLCYRGEMLRAIGLDFGTTNSAVAFADAEANVRTQRFHYEANEFETFRSILYFAAAEKGSGKRMLAYAGPEAIHHYLHSDHGGRLIQSIKSYLSNPSLRATNLFGRNYRFEEIVAYLLRSLKTSASPLLNDGPGKVVVGRPVRFVGSKNSADDDFAISRLREALQLAGIHDVEFEFEPVAAAYSYETRLKQDELLLVGDFGGGTTDFTLIRVGPNARKLRSAKQRIVASAGLGLAGDAFDAKLVRHVVSPLLGHGSLCRLIGKTATMPNWPYTKLEHWHHLSFLKSKENMDALRSLRAQAIEPEKIESLIMLITEDLGFQLHSAVQRTKFELSSVTESTFRFEAPGIHITQKVQRKDFEHWIAEELYSIAHKLDQLLNDASLAPSAIDRVFLTGGSSFVPSVRAIFERRFGNDRISGGSEFTSVAQGLALRALELQQRAHARRR
jgi:hypothetical chaperone protein